MNKWVRLLVTYFFGIFGVHKFIDKQYGMGVLYLCTCGLFVFGWIYDVIKAFIALFEKRTKAHTHYNNSGKDMVVAEQYNNSNIRVMNTNNKFEEAGSYNTINTNSSTDFYDNTIYNEIRIVQESAYLIDTSNNLDTVIGRIQFIPEHIQYLKQLEKQGLYATTPTASDYYSQYVMLKDKCIQNAIIRNYKDMLDKANLLKTDRGRINKINKYFEKLEKYKPMLSPIMQSYIDNFIKVRQQQ